MSAVRITSVDHPTQREWLEVVADDPSSMADHSPAWNDAIVDRGGFVDATRCYRLADGRRFVVPLVHRRLAGHRGGWLASPPPAWGFGGVVGRHLDAEVLRAVVDDLAGLDALRVSVRPDPSTAELWRELDRPGLLRVPRFAHVLDLPNGPDGVDARFSRNARHGARRARNRGVTVRTERSGALLDEHYRLYLLSVERWARSQREPRASARWRAVRRDPLEKLRAMADRLGPAFCHHLAYHEGAAVASVIVLLGNAAHDTRAAMDRDRAAPVQANDLLTCEAVRHAAAEGVRRYHFGESRADSPLARFKEKFGATGVAYDEVRIERLPLTRVDAAARRTVKRAIGFRDA